METDWTPLGRLNLSAKDAAIVRKAAALDPALAAKVGIKVGTGRRLAASADYGLGNIQALPATNVKAGDPIFIDVYGEIQDLTAGYPDQWQIVVAAAAVDSYQNPTSQKVFKYFTSQVQGKKFPLDNVIVITDSFVTLPWHSHLVLPGVMPNSQVTWFVSFYASHSNTSVWDWSMWKTVFA